MKNIILTTQVYLSNSIMPYFGGMKLINIHINPKIIFMSTVPLVAWSWFSSGDLVTGFTILATNCPMAAMAAGSVSLFPDPLSCVAGTAFPEDVRSTASCCRPNKNNTDCLQHRLQNACLHWQFRRITLTGKK